MHRLLNARKAPLRQISLPGIGSVFVVILLLGGYFSYVQVKQSTEAFYAEELKTNGNEVLSYFDTAIKQYQRDIRFLANTPPISGLHRAEQHGGVDPFDNTLYGQWKTRLETIFTSYMQFNPYIDQLRVIKASGEEEIRTERVDSHVQVAEVLQNKADRHYFTGSLALAPGDTYISPINLNREFDKVQYPLKPVIQLGQAIFDEQGKLWGIVVVNINATTLLADMKGLVQLPESIILTSASGHFVMHPETGLAFSNELAPELTWNQRYKLTGYKTESVLTFMSLVTNKHYLGTERMLRYGGNGDDYMTAYVILPVAVLVDAAFTRNLTFFALLLIVSAIAFAFVYLFSRSAQSSAELAETRELAGNIVNQSFDAIISLDEHGRVLSWNSAAERLLGVSAENVVGKLLTSVAIFKGFNYAENANKLFNASHSHLMLDYEVNSENGSPTLALTLSMNLLSANAGASHVALIVRDVTAQMLAERELRLANEHLEKEVTARTRELETARDEAQASSDVKSGFISNISHEMRTPLNGIIGGLKLLGKEPQTHKGSHYVELIDTSANALDVLINDILDLSKIEAGKLELVPQVFEPRGLIEMLCKSMAVKAYEKGLEFFIDVSGINSQTITLDKNRFSQILNNLINNACKFTHKGYIWVSAWDEVQKNGEVSLHVAIVDTGIGISPTNQSKLFEAFIQAKSTIAIQYGGTGLGLSISRQLAILLGGNVEFTSVEGQGSEFTVTVIAEAAQQSESINVKPLKGKRIVICAVSHDVSRWATQICETLGAEVLRLDSLPTANTSTTYSTNVIDAIIAEQQCLLDSPVYNALESDAVDDFPLIMLMTAPGEELKIQNRSKVMTQLYKPVAESEMVLAFTGGVGKDSKRLQPAAMTGALSSQILQQIKGARVLIVDDNETNVAVATGIMEHLAVNILTAANGQEAIDKLHGLHVLGTPCHCVLMDCQMPVLSGYDATQRIRKGMAGASHTEVAIVAMTASAMSGERERCIASGMDDFITKPLDFEQVQTSVASYIAKVYKSSDSGDALQVPLELATPTTTHATSETINWDKSKALKRLRGKESLYKKVCDLFVQRLPDKIAELDNALNSGAFEQIRKSAHALKGMCADIGANTIAENLQELESGAAKGISIDSIATLFEETKPQLWQLQALVHNYVKGD